MEGYLTKSISFSNDYSLVVATVYVWDPNNSVRFNFSANLSKGTFLSKLLQNTSSKPYIKCYIYYLENVKKDDSITIETGWFRVCEVRAFK